VRWLYANLGYKLIAVAVAFLLWGVAHSSSSTQRGFDVPMVLRGIPDDLVIVDQSADEVNVRIQGTRAALRNISPADLEYPIEVSGAKPGVLTVDVDPTPLDLPRGAEIVSRSPSRVELTLARRGSKAVRVRPDVTGEPAPGFQVDTVEVNPPRVRITGAQTEVLRLNEVPTETIDVTGATADVVKEASVALGGSHVWLEQAQPVEVRVGIVPVPPEEAPAPPTARKPAKRGAQPEAQGRRG
jgi:YbbR domain-containing protein